MTVGGVICEFNPFHNGHRYLLQRMRQDGTDGIVACMSGSFTQRGEPAVFDKYVRTRAALQNGADIVIELPSIFACAGAERFAFGGVFLLSAMGCVNRLYFGSECGEIRLIQYTAEILSGKEFSAVLQDYVQSGETFAAAREKAVRSMAGDKAANILTNPNDILGTEYCKALLRLNSPIKPVCIRRSSVLHDSPLPNGSFASASFLRRELYQGNDISPFIPENTHQVVLASAQSLPKSSRMAALEGAMLYRLRMMSQNELRSLPDISEGLENRLYTAIQRGTSIEEILSLAKCKRYTLSRLQRCLLHALLGLTKSNTTLLPQYIRVLGFNKTGQRILRLCKQNASLPVITKHSQTSALSIDAKQQYALECRCDDIYALSGKNILPCGTSASAKMIVL